MCGKPAVMGLLSATLGLSACLSSNNGSENSGEQEDRETAVFEGLYEGTLTDKSGTEEADLVYLTMDGRAIGVSLSKGVVYDGKDGIHDDEFSGQYLLYDAGGLRSGRFDFSGVLTRNEHIAGRILENGVESGEFDLTLHPDVHRDLTFHEVAGLYKGEGEGQLQIAIDTEGRLEGGDIFGCQVDGDLRKSVPEMNVFEISITTRNGQCQDLPGYDGAKYHGMAAFIDDGILFSSTNDEVAGKGASFARFLAQAGRKEDPEYEDIPVWLQDLPEQAWAKVNTNTKDDAIDALDAATNGCGRRAFRNEIRRVWEAFAGSAWDTTRKVAWIFGGGHAVTTFNAPIAIDVHERKWRILHTETRSIDSDFDGQYASGLYVTADFAYDYQGPPPSAHAYDNNKYLEVADQFITFGGAQAGDGSWWRKFLDRDGTQVEGWPSGGERTGPYLYNYEKKDPSRVGGNDATAAEASGCDASAGAGAQAWTNLDFMEELPSSWLSPDRSTVCRVENGKDICYHSRTSLRRIEFDGGSATVDPAGRAWQGHIGEHSAVVVPVGDEEIFLQVRLRPDPQPFNHWDLKWWEIQDFPTLHDSEVVGNVNIGTTSVDYSASSYGVNGPLADEGATPGVAYDTRRNKIIVWRGGENLYELIPPQPLSSRGWTVVDFQDSPVSEKAPDVSGRPDLGRPHRGVIGHFHYDPEWDLFFGVEGVHGDLWVYKPAAWSPE